MADIEFLHDDDPVTPNKDHMQRGLTVRDYLAGQALAGMDMMAESAHDIAYRAYEIADFMIVQRNEDAHKPRT